MDQKRGRKEGIIGGEEGKEGGRKMMSGTELQLDTHSCNKVHPFHSWSEKKKKNGRKKMMVKTERRIRTKEVRIK